MAVVKSKPTSAGRRHQVKVVTEGLHKGRPHGPLLEKKSKTGGRNNAGRITTRHIGGGHKQHYRKIDFKRTKDGIGAKVERIEYDPNRTAHIALFFTPMVSVATSSRQRVLRRATYCTQVLRRRSSQATVLPVRSIPVGSVVHAIELKPGKGAQLARSAGASVQLVAREGQYATIRLRSGEMRKVPIDCRATLGEVSNSEHSLRKLGKAGAARWRGVRPTVRGVAMNPVDHPHGGGEGKTSGGRHPVTPWGVPTKGYKTRKNKRTDGMIVRRRGKK